MGGSDTIVALSSGALPSGVAVIRLSGTQTRSIVEAVAGVVPPPRTMALRSIKSDRETLDQGLIVFFPAPNSFTGEDCAELQVHGSPAGVRAILRLLIDQGARLAEAGEFTRRAFTNGKLDLVEIEGLGDLLAAETESQRRQAIARFGGGLTQQIDHWRDQLLDLRSDIEARLDFSDEGDVSELPETFANAVAALHRSLGEAIASVGQGRVIREGLRVALAGPPNVGKSSLLNALAKSDIAIVTEEAGTTRDVREVPVDIDGQLIIFLDLAGLRETGSKAEAEGIRRARAEIDQADLVLWLSSPDVPDIDMPSDGRPVWRVLTKSDLTGAHGDLSVSSKTQQGMADLMEKIAEFAQDQAGVGEPILLSRERDRVALEQAQTALVEAMDRLDAPELAAESLRIASHALERLVGRIDSERVLDRLFANFCIGK